MIKSYLRIALRNLWKHNVFSFINIFGLALSLFVCMIVIIRVKGDLSYDLFHPHRDRIYRILSDIVENKNDKQYRLASTPIPLEHELSQRKDIVEAAVQLYPALNGKAMYGDKELPVKGTFTGPSFFRVFGFKLAAGDEKTALELTNGIVLSSEMASRFFGKTDPVGKVLDFGKMGLFRVTGVLETPPGKSHIDFDAYASSSALPQLEKTKVLPALQNNWNSLNYAYTYVLLRKDIPVKNLDRTLKQISLSPALRSAEGKVTFISQPLSKITPGTEGIYNEIGSGTVWNKVLTVIGIGFIILLAACFNYTNLTIARALTRSKEIGIRKVSGAKRYQIFSQYIIESVLMALLALALALLALLQFRPDLRLNVPLLVSFVFFTIIAGCFAGAFPAWILSAFKPVNVLKSMSTQKIFGNISLQKGLMIFQFSLSLLVIIFLSAYYRQFEFLKTVDPGFYSKNILTIPFSGRSEIFSNRVATISGVEKLSRTSEDFGMRGDGSVPVFLNKPGTEQGVLCDFYFTDAAAIDVHHLKLTAGENFPVNGAYEREKFILINESASNVLGFKDPRSAIGKTVWLNDSTQVQIRGVVKDFYDKGAARRINPLVLRNRDDAFNYLNVAINAADKDQVVKRISAVWHELNPHVPFEYQWLDRKIAGRDDQSDTYATMGFLAFVTISIASLGLLGLVIYTVETRRKEISIRKVIGAKPGQLMFILSKGFLKLLVIAGLIAMPTGYLASYFFLQNFPNRVPFGAGTLLSSFLFLFTIGLVTILSNTYKASVENPLKNLRVE